MVFRTAFHMMSSHETRDLVCLQITVTFHGIRPPFIALSAISFVSDLFFTVLAKFQGIVSANDFRFPFRFQELLQASLCFLRSFCFARIRLDPLSDQVLLHDCMSRIVSRFTTFTENFLICCDQITKNFCTRYDSAIASSARRSCNFGPLTDLTISVFREVNINTVFTQIHISHSI